jgi:glycosyltransferase involved in cell wall biosynthesis
MPPTTIQTDAAPEVSIIVPHLNQPEHLARLLASLHAQAFDMGRAEVIVVDNGSRRLPREVVAGFPGVRLAEETVPGPGPTRNRGVALARGALLAFTDADCQVARDWLPAILARFADPGLAILGGDIRIFPAETGRPTMAEAYECVYGFPQRQYITRQGFSVTANLVTRRAVFEAVGPFAGIEIAEDTDWGQRAAGLGHVTVYAPEVVVHHPARRSLAELYTKWDRNIGHHYEAFARGPAGKAKWAAKTLAMGLSPVAEIPRILRSDRIAGAGPRLRAFAGLAAVRGYRARKMLAVMLTGARTERVQWNR